MVALRIPVSSISRHRPLMPSQGRLANPWKNLLPKVPSTWAGLVKIGGALFTDRRSDQGKERALQI